MSKDTIGTDDVKGLITAWLNASKNESDNYLTKEGMAYLNGFLQANNTMYLIKIEKYEELTKQYEELIDKYDFEKRKSESFLSDINNLKSQIKRLKNKKRWFKW